MALIKCEECGKQVSDKASACPNCGCPIEKKIKCEECGTLLSPKDEVCPSCGCPIENDIVHPKTDIIGRHKIWLIVCIIALVGIILILIISIMSKSSYVDNNNNDTNDFNDKIDFEKIVDSSPWTCDYYKYCIVASDGSYLKFDTKPNDNEYSDDASTAYFIEDVNERLGFSSSLYAKMESSRGIDGKQTEENDKVKVTWSYVSSKGLEVIYELK